MTIVHLIQLHDDEVDPVPLVLLSRKQAQVWNALVEWRGVYPPTMRELKQAAGIGSMRTMVETMDQLEQARLIRRGHFGSIAKPRAIELLVRVA